VRQVLEYGACYQDLQSQILNIFLSLFSAEAQIMTWTNPAAMRCGPLINNVSENKRRIFLLPFHAWKAHKRTRTGTCRTMKQIVNHNTQSPVHTILSLFTFVVAVSCFLSKCFIWAICEYVYRLRCFQTTTGMLLVYYLRRRNNNQRSISLNFNTSLADKLTEIWQHHDTSLGNILYSFFSNSLL